LQHRLPTRTANAHDVQNVVNLDEIIEYSTNTYRNKNCDERREASMYTPDALIAHISEQANADSAPPGDIRQVLTSQLRPICRKDNNIKAHATFTTPATMTMGDTTFYHNKGETVVTFEGHQYSTHATMIQYSYYTVRTRTGF
jgi:hypothetical protein